MSGVGNDTIIYHPRHEEGTDGGYRRLTPRTRSHTSELRHGKAAAMLAVVVVVVAVVGPPADEPSCLKSSDLRSSGKEGKLFPRDGVHSIGCLTTRQTTRDIRRLANTETGEEELEKVRSFMHSNDPKTRVCFWRISDITCIDIRLERGWARMRVR